MGPKTLLSSRDVLEKIDEVCKRRFQDENEQMEFQKYVIHKLKEKDYKRLRSYKKESSLTTYLNPVLNNLATDFLRKKIGKWYIPVGIRRMGNLSVETYRLLCKSKFSLSEIYDIFVIRRQYAGKLGEFMKEFEPVRNTPCPEKKNFVPTNNPSEKTMDVMMSTDPNPLEHLMENLESDRRIKAGRVIREVTNTLSEAEQSLVRLVYADDLSVSAAARVAGLNPPAARRRLKKILAGYRKALLAKGIGKEER